MSRDVRRFARFYYAEFQRDYPAVYDDDAAFSAFIRLLSLAEAAWPAHPELPRSIRPRALAILVDHRLVRLSGHRFELKGWVKERTAREASGRAGAVVRWDSERTANAYADAGTDALQGQGQGRREAKRDGNGTVRRAAGPRVVEPFEETA